MSSGRFVRSKYQSDDEEIHPIRVQPETLALTADGTANAAPSGNVTNKIPAKVSAGAREFALSPRQITVVFDQLIPDGYEADSPIRLPILQRALFDSINKDDTVEYLGTTAKVISKRGERPE